MCPGALVWFSGTRWSFAHTHVPLWCARHSPEIWQNRPYDDKSDMWSIGCILYEMCALRPPFRGRDLEDLAKRVQAGYVGRRGGCWRAPESSHPLMRACGAQVLPPHPFAVLVRPRRDGAAAPVPGPASPTVSEAGA